MESNMRVQVAKMGVETIQGYQHVVCSDNYINFMDISDNECTEILANDILDCFSVEKIAECLQLIVSKLRLGGSVVVGGKDARLFSKAVINGQVKEQEASQIINSVNSMSSVGTIAGFIQGLGLDISSTQIAGIHFEVKATRSK
tara:strand:- start:1602 stop:2033 length:432 start_codon:yes stop_codon:yes gene_type:complete